MAVILHITTGAGWRAAVAAGSYRPASLDREGFIHGSTYDPRADQRFAHLDGPLAPEAVVRVVAFPPGPSGSFRVPPGLP
jgi:uncharacterized protein (DUF952 family)